jgi:hypothetical protein
MNDSDKLDDSIGQADQNLRSLQDTIDSAKEAIERAYALIARTHELRQAHKPAGEPVSSDTEDSPAREGGAARKAVYGSCGGVSRRIECPDIQSDPPPNRIPSPHPVPLKSATIALAFGSIWTSGTSLSDTHT